MQRRQFLTATGGALALSAAKAAPADTSAAKTIPAETCATPGAAPPPAGRPFNAAYEGDHLSEIAFPLGGIGAGMICIEGTGALSHVSIRHHPDVLNEPALFAAVAVKGSGARLLEGPVPHRKIFNPPESGLGGRGTTYGLPRFTRATFASRFPFATIALGDEDFPLEAELTAWSPFEAGDADASSLPVGALEYRLTNRSAETAETVFSFNAINFLANEFAEPERAAASQGIDRIDDGFVLWCARKVEQRGSNAALSVTVSDPERKIDCAWFRGGWSVPLSMTWKIIEQAGYRDAPPPAGAPSPGATLYVPVTLPPGASRTIVVRLAWHCRTSNLRSADSILAWDNQVPASIADGYQPHYAGRFATIADVTAYWRDHHAALRDASRQFAACLQGEGLPPEIVEAVAANLGILKSPTVLRQVDGRLWGWEGSQDKIGSCFGTCTHVWNYAQAVPHLFPELERSLRETEYFVSQDDSGHQCFRTPLPIRAPKHDFYAAADGQLGGIVKTYRDWRIGGDDAWLARLWPKLAKSLDYCIATWDPGRRGVIEEPHHNTYDIEFWGAEPMCTSLYLAALSAAIAMGGHLGKPTGAYGALLAAGRSALETRLFNGDYFHQIVATKGLRAKDPTRTGYFSDDVPPEARILVEREGPRYQYGPGCLSDGVIGAWLAWTSGLDSPVDPAKVRSHLAAVHRHNYKPDLTRHACPQRPRYAMAGEGGLLLCSWPNGGQPTLPFIYSDEVWTGIEYQVASHMIAIGLVDEGLEIVRSCRARYDGRVRNPFDEFEYGHWYARAMASFALLQAISGARYDAVDRTLHLAPRIKGDFRSLLSTATGYGEIGVRGGQPFLNVLRGTIPYRSIAYRPA